jgi:FkbM family methyltransferase
MSAHIPYRRPFFGKVRTSVLKRRLRLIRGIAKLRGRKDLRVTSRYFGATFRVDPDDIIGDGIATNRIEWREITMMIAACREHRPVVFIDVGANIGLYSCILAKTGAVPRAVSFEPDRRNFAQLIGNIERNSLTAFIDPRACAVGAKCGVASLAPAQQGNSGLSTIERSGAGEYSVTMVALDEEIGVRDSPIAVKIDVEGFELEVLAGAADLFRWNGGYAQIEGHGEARALEIKELMKGYGWQFLDRYGLDLRFQRHPASIKA